MSSAQPSLLNFLSDRDVFGHPITLNYRGQDTYTTFFNMSRWILVHNIYDHVDGIYVSLV